MKTFLFIATLALAVTACKKDGNSATDVITYEATLSFGTFASIVYLDENGEEQVGQPGTGSWKITFTNKTGRPRKLEFIVSPYIDLTDPNAQVPDTDVSISVNGSKVKSQTYKGDDFVDFMFVLN